MTRKKILTVLRVAIALITLAAVVYAVVHNWADVSVHLDKISWTTFLWSTLAAARRHVADDDRLEDAAARPRLRPAPRTRVRRLLRRPARQVPPRLAVVGAGAGRHREPPQGAAPAHRRDRPARARAGPAHRPARRAPGRVVPAHEHRVGLRLVAAPRHPDPRRALRAQAAQRDHRPRCCAPSSASPSSSELSAGAVHARRRHLRARVGRASACTPCCSPGRSPATPRPTPT